MSEPRFRGERLQIMLTPDELCVVDDFREAPNPKPSGSGQGTAKARSCG